MTEKTETAEPKAPRRGVGTVIREAIAAGKTNEAALEAAQAEFPEAKTTLASVSWYRNEARKKDPTIPSARAVKKAKAEEAADPLG
jgi:hypothetical protein